MGEQALPGLAELFKSERLAVRAAEMNPKLLRVSATWRSMPSFVFGNQTLSKTHSKVLVFFCVSGCWDLEWVLAIKCFKSFKILSKCFANHKESSAHQSWS